MNSRRHILLVIVGVRPVHACHIKNEVANLSVEIALVDIPLAAVFTRYLMEVLVKCSERHGSTVGIVRKEARLKLQSWSAIANEA